MIPRTNRGIVAINELPDLPERIQVSLFNILEERDVQIRGYRDPAAARPAAGRHREPRRLHASRPDRLAAEGSVRHAGPDPLPRDACARRSASWIRRHGRRPGGVPVRVPAFMKEVVAALTAELRRSPHVNHRSGVSVRYSIGNLETLQAAAVRRAARTGEPEAVPRVVRPARRADVQRGPRGVRHDRGRPRGRDPAACAAHRRARGLPSPAVRLRLLSRSCTGSTKGSRVDTGELTPASDLLATVGDLPGLAKLLERLGVEEESPGRRGERRGVRAGRALPVTPAQQGRGRRRGALHGCRRLVVSGRVRCARGRRVLGGRRVRRGLDLGLGRVDRSSRPG